MKCNDNRLTACLRFASLTQMHPAYFKNNGNIKQNYMEGKAMKRFICGILLIFMIGLIQSPLLGQEVKVGAKKIKSDLLMKPFLRFMSFNIRYNNPGDGENAWPNRKDFAASMIRFHRADFAGLQEALKGQIDDLAERLPEYGWFGVGRDDGKEGGEFTPIFYRKDRFEFLEKSTFWLSEEPEVPGSRGWDTAITRIVTWGRFRDKTTGKVFFHFNTHFDHRGLQAREESARLLLIKIEKIAETAPIIVTGDFNCMESSIPYQILTKGDGSEALKDARYISVHGHHGPTGTSSGFKVAGTPGRKIDYIFIKNGVQVLQHGVLSDTWDGRFPSDHLPVLAEVIIE